MGILNFNSSKLKTSQSILLLYLYYATIFTKIKCTEVHILVERIEKINDTYLLVSLGQIFQYQRQLAYGAMSRENFIYQASIDNPGILNTEWISLRSLANIENGKNVPSLYTLRNLAIAYGIDLADLVKKIELYIP